MSEYTAQLARLTEEEQAIYAKEWRDRADFERLARIQQARELIWNLERSRRCGLSEGSVPVEGWRCDRGGFVFPRPRRERGMHYQERDTETPRALPKGVEQTSSGRVRAIIAYTRDQKLSLGTFANTPEQIALAGRVAEAARQARDAGGSVGEVQAAALAAYQQEEHSYAAD